MDSTSPRPRADWRYAAAPLVFTALAYARSLGNGFVSDDNLMVSGNRYLSEWSFIPRSFAHDVWWFLDPRVPQSLYYRPLEDTWLALNYHLFGQNPAYWHASMIALHLVAVWLVFRLALELTCDPLASKLGALLFGLMPIHADTISWGRSYPVPAGATFEMAALFCFIRRARAPRLNLALALIWFALALLSHEGPVVFPFIVAAYVLLLDRAGDSAERVPAGGALARLARSAIEAAPFVAVDLCYLALRLWALGFITRLNPKNNWSAAATYLTVPKALAEFLLVMLLPWRAGPAHPLTPVERATAPGYYVPLLGISIAVAAAYLLLRRHPHRRLYLFCAALAVIALAPVLNLKSLNPVIMIQDRYLYLSSAGWCIAVGDLVAGYIAERNVRAWIAGAAAAGLAVWYGAALWSVERYWHDDLAYFSRCVALYPDSWLCRENLAVELWRRGDLHGAERQLESGIPLDPSAGRWLVSLGRLHIQLHQFDRAEDELARGLALMEHSPLRTEHPSVGAYVQLGQLAAALGDTETSRMAFERARALSATAPTSVRKGDN